MKHFDIDYADDRVVRLWLSRLIEPDDQLFIRMREWTRPSELLRAITEPDAPHPAWPEELVRRLESRRAGLRLRLAQATAVEADLERAAAVEARFLIPRDEEWPTRVDDLGTGAPFGLWIIGAFPPNAPAVSVVGARSCTGYGNQVAGSLSAELARAGTVVVSGAALGVDGAAHRGALAVGGTTVAVLACGVDRKYPAAHDTLIQAIGERGAVLAELAPGTSPTRFRFLARNRLIAALGLGTVVVEAAGRSGSLVTAGLAADLGRAVLAVPGPVTSRLSAGTNRLLCDGAIPAVDAHQILAELGVELPERLRNRGSTGPRDDRRSTSRGEDADRGEVEPELSPHAVLVREALPTARSGRAAEVLALAAETGLEPATVLASLGRLAAIGRAVKTGGGWALVG